MERKSQSNVRCLFVLNRSTNKGIRPLRGGTAGPEPITGQDGSDRKDIRMTIGIVRDARIQNRPRRRYVCQSKRTYFCGGSAEPLRR